MAPGITAVFLPFLLLLAGPVLPADSASPARVADSAAISPLYLLDGGSHFRADTIPVLRDRSVATVPDTGNIVMIREFQGKIDSADESGVRDINEHYSKTGRIDQGIACYKHFLNDNPYSNKARIGLGQLLGWSGRYGEAILHYEAVLKEAPGTEAAQMGLALVLGWDHQFNRAESLFQEIYTRNPRNQDAKVNHARLMSWQNRWDEAIKTLTEVLEENPKNLYAHEAIGFIFKWKHDYRDAYHHFEAISRLEGDPAVIVNAHFQLAELDWWAGRTLLAQKRLKDVARDHPEEIRFRKRSDEIADFLAWKFEVSIDRYQEITDDGASLTGSGNNSARVTVRKNFNLATGLKAVYQLRNETADHSSPVRDDVLFNVGVHAFHLEPEFRYKDSAAFNFFYAPDYFFNLSASKPELDGSTVFQGAGFLGMVNTRRARLYFGITRSPWLSRSADLLWVQSRYTGSASALLLLPRQVTLIPSAVIHTQEDRNRLQEYSLEALHPLPWRDLEGKARLFYKRYSDQVPDYFSYRHWAALEPGAAMTFRPLPWLSVLTEATAGIHWLDLGPGQKFFGSFGLGAKPTARFGEPFKVRFELSGRLNTDGYYLYYAGLGYGL